MMGDELLQKKDLEKKEQFFEPILFTLESSGSK
jgi:hypothetical protein